MIAFGLNLLMQKMIEKNTEVFLKYRAIFICHKKTKNFGFYKHTSEHKHTHTEKHISNWPFYK